MPETELLDRFRKEVLPKVADIFKNEQAGWNQMSITTARKVVEYLFVLSMRLVANDLGVNFNSLDADAKALIIVEFVRGLNGALPLDHNFIVVIFAVASENNLWRLGVIHRRDIPGMHDCLNPAMFPIINIATKQELDCEHLRFKDTAFLGGDEWDPSLAQ